MQVKEYIVSYPTGAGGTWISWLINQHNNFPKIQLEDDDQFYDKTAGDAIGAFHFAIAARRKLFSNQTAAEFLYQFLEQNPQCDRNFTKYSYKPSPHAPSSVLEYVKQTPNHIFHNNTSVIIVGTWSCQELFKSRNDYINGLHNIYGAFANSRDQYITGHNEDCDALHTICNDHGIKSMTFDAGRLLFGDLEEYHKLCQYIGEPPLEQYQSFVDTAVNKVWKKFK